MAQILPTAWKGALGSMVTTIRDTRRMQSHLMRMSQRRVWVRDSTEDKEGLFSHQRVILNSAGAISDKAGSHPTREGPRFRRRYKGGFSLLLPLIFEAWRHLFL